MADHLNAGVRAAFGPDPVVTTWCAHAAYRTKWLGSVHAPARDPGSSLERALARFGQLLQQGRALNKAEASDQYVKSALITVLPHYQQHWSQFRLEVPAGKQAMGVAAPAPTGKRR
jgi:hypothetical protein